MSDGIGNGAQTGVVWLRMLISSIQTAFHLRVCLITAAHRNGSPRTHFENGLKTITLNGISLWTERSRALMALGSQLYIKLKLL